MRECGGVGGEVWGVGLGARGWGLGAGGLRLEAGNGRNRLEMADVRLGASPWHQEQTRFWAASDRWSASTEPGQHLTTP